MSKLTDKLVGPGEKPKLSPNPDGSGYVQQVEVDSLSSVVDPKENVLYLVEGRQYKYLKEAIIHPGTQQVIVPAGWVRVENGPQSLKVNRGQETPRKVVTEPKERPQVFNIPVSFLKDIFVKGKKLEDYIDSEGGVTEEEMHQYVPQAIAQATANDAKVWEFIDIFEESADLTDYDISLVKPGDIIVDEGMGMVGIVAQKGTNEIYIYAFDNNPTLYFYGSANLEAWTEVLASVTGTKLYQHSLLINNTIEIIVISTDYFNITGDDSADFRNLLINALSIKDIDGGALILESVSYTLQTFSGGAIDEFFDTGTFTDCEDTVTPL